MGNVGELVFVRVRLLGRKRTELALTRAKPRSLPGKNLPGCLVRRERRNETDSIEKRESGETRDTKRCRINDTTAEPG